MTKRFLITISGCILLVAVVVVAAVVVIIPRLLDLDSYREQIVAMAEKSLNRNVSYKTGSVSWHFGPSFVFRGVIIEERSGGKPLLEADRFSFKLALLPLLRKEVRIRELVLERPVLVLNRNEAGQFNIDDLFTAKPSKFKVHVKAVRIKNGLVLFTDHFYDPEGFTASLENLDLTISSLSRGTTSRFRLSTVVPDKEGRSEVSVSGTTGIPAQGEPSGDVQVDAALSAKNLNVGRYWPYYGRYLPFEKIHGNLDIDGMFKGKPTEFTTKGSIRIRNLLLNYPQVFHAVLTPKELQLGYDVELTPRNLSAISLNLTVDGLRVKGSFALDDIHGSDPRIIARASTSPFRLEEFRRYIPYGVIAKDTADFIEQHIKGGIYRLDEGSLNGRVSRILHMDRDDNYNVLSIRGSVDEGLVTIGPRVPTFNNIRGELEIRGKDFIMRRMTGNFGGSPFSLEGKIADFPLDKPSSYPFDMTITPRQEEVFWLSRQGKSRKLAFNGPSVLRLSGSGIAADYRLAGSWDLSRAEYNFKQLVHKRAGLTNRITFSARLGKTETRLSDLRYRLPPLELSARATYRFKDKESLSFVVDTNRFTMGRSLPIFPGLSKYRPTGTLQTHIEGRGNPARADSLRLNGSLSLAGFSVRPLEQITPLSGIRGTIRFTESSLETKRMTGRLGHSAFSVKGRVAGVSNPTVDVDFSSPGLHPEDLGYRYEGGKLEVKDLLGHILLKDGNLAINSLSGRVNRSAFEITGDIHDIRNPKIALNVSFPFLRVEDMTPLTRLKHAGGDKVLRIRALKVRVTTRVGTVRQIPFEKLDTELSLENSRLVVETMRVGIFDGSVSGNGQADFSAAVGPTYDASYRLNHIDAAKLLRAAGVKGYITGLLSAKGELTVRGNSADEWKKNARVSAQIELNNGMIRPAMHAGSGTARAIPFEKLFARISFERNVLDVYSTRIDAFGGVISGHGAVDFHTPLGPAYRVECRMEFIDAAEFFRAFGVTKNITGLLSLRGELTARGDSAAALKKTVRGSVGMYLEKGVINRFHVLSKVFSILNVSQLLNFRLPDMLTDGMPYDRIEGNLSINDGIVSTSDLSIDSPSINVTIVGKTDIVKEYIDLTIGVQPLQTVGEVVGRIPVIGWILTGGNRQLLVTYYEARGKWDDPKVSAIPVTSLTWGVFNIFKRAFSLPGKMITDTGEVIMGK
jgi:uncharacterized protein involved in outer membrane biogenesis